MRTLDKNKPFATVHGEQVPYRYEQDGLKFAANGTQVLERGERPAPDAPKAPEGAEAQLAAQMGGGNDAPPDGLVVVKGKAPGKKR